MSNRKFEEAMGRLEEIVKALEKGDLSLEESLRIFEEGVKLSKGCLKMLDEAEKKIEILLGNKEGKREPEAFRLSESSPERPGSPGEDPGSPQADQDRSGEKSSPRSQPASGSNRSGTK